MKKSSNSTETAFVFSNKDQEDVPNFSKLSVIPKVRELQKFGARKQGKIFHQSDHKYCFVYIKVCEYA